ncbi:MAG: transposase [Betaproteobacteria bacterium]
MRRQENKALLALGDTRLVRSRFLWLRGAQALSEVAQERFIPLMDSSLKTARAWAMKESLRTWWSYRSRSQAEQFWKRWYYWATHSRQGSNLVETNSALTHAGSLATLQ